MAKKRAPIRAQEGKRSMPAPQLQNGAQNKRGRGHPSKDHPQDRMQPDQPAAKKLKTGAAAANGSSGQQGGVSSNQERHKHEQAGGGGSTKNSALGVSTAALKKKASNLKKKKSKKAPSGSGTAAAAAAAGNEQEGGEASHTATSSAQPPTAQKKGAGASTKAPMPDLVGKQAALAAREQAKQAAKQAQQAKAAQKKGKGAAKKPSPPGVVQAGSNWEALKAKIGATGKGAELARQREAALGKKPRSLGTNTGVTPIIALDCEMVGVGPDGDRSSLARVAVINEHGNVLLDVFVKQKEKVTDYRTKYSGVRPVDVKSPEAVDLEEAQKKVAELMQGRILVGHGLSNDLKAMMLDHPRKDMRDTARYLPFMHQPAPGRKHKPRALRVLAAERLGLDIQAGEHSPVDDARAALYLYLRHKKEWEAALRSGTLKQDALAVKAARKAALEAAKQAAQSQKGPGAAQGAHTEAAVPCPESASSASKKYAGLSASQIRSLRTGRGVNKVPGALGAGNSKEDRRNMTVGGWLDVVKGSAPQKPGKKKG